MIKTDTPACVLFDFDGVCADTERYGIELDREVYELYGINPTREEMQSLVGTTGLESIPALFRKYGLTVTAQEFFAKRRDNTCIYRDFPLEAEPGLIGVLADLRARRIPIGLVSTTAASSIFFALDRLHLASSLTLEQGCERLHCCRGFSRWYSCCQGGRALCDGVSRCEHQAGYLRGRRAARRICCVSRVVLHFFQVQLAGHLRASGEAFRV